MIKIQKLGLGLLFSLLLPATSYAAFIYDLSLDLDPFPSLGSGQIEFSTISGSDVSGVNAFSFTGSSTFSDPAAVFDIGDIIAVNWFIDSNHNLSTFFLQAAYEATNPSNQEEGFYELGLEIGGRTLIVSGPCTSRSESAANTGYMYRCFETTSTVGDRRTTTATAVPSPPTIALFVLGLAGVGWLRRKRA